MNSGKYIFPQMIERDYHIFEENTYYPVNEARQKRVTHIFKLGSNIYAFDSTTIDLCISVSCGLNPPKSGIKTHILYDVETQFPAFFHITEAAIHNSIFCCSYSKAASFH